MKQGVAGREVVGDRPLLALLSVSNCEAQLLPLLGPGLLTMMLLMEKDNWASTTPLPGLAACSEATNTRPSRCVLQKGVHASSAAGSKGPSSTATAGSADPEVLLGVLRGW